MENAKKLEKYVDLISDMTGIPMAMVKIELADDVGADYENLSEKDIAAMVNLFEEEFPNVRICTTCEHPMGSGYFVDEGRFCYCSKRCLKADYSESDYEEMYEEGSAYWSTIDVGIK